MKFVMLTESTATPPKQTQQLWLPGTPPANLQPKTKQKPKPCIAEICHLLVHRNLP